MTESKTTSKAYFYARNKDRCTYCDVVVLKAVSPEHPRKKTKEHLLPKSMGGKKIAVACLRCNNMKNNMSEQHFRCLIKEYGFTPKLPAACRAYLSARDKRLNAKTMGEVAHV